MSQRYDLLYSTHLRGKGCGRFADMLEFSPIRLSENGCKTMARIVFFGTPRFGVPVLEALAQHHQVLGVITQPDRVAGRGRAQRAMPAVKQTAQKLGLPVLQPASLRHDAKVLEWLQQSAADLFVVAAFGQLLPPSILAIPAHGCIGVHASLLPDLRGAAPVAAAILRGDRETGVSLMLTDAGMDTGPIIAQRRISIAPDDTTESLSEKLAFLGAELLIETLPAWLAGQITPVPQDDSRATYAPPIKKSDGLIDWRLSAEEIARRVRAFSPWPGAFTSYLGKNLRVLRARPLPDFEHVAIPGTVVEGSEGIGVVTGKGLLLLETVQLEGKRGISAREFACGQRQFVGSVLGG